MTEFVPDRLVALGANLPSRAGTPVETLSRAISALADNGVLIRAVSRFYATPCFPAGAGPDFVNAAISVRCERPAAAFLALLHELEAGFGRVRTERWAGRTLDLDLLADGTRIAPDAETVERWMSMPPERQAQAAPEEMLLPHPRIQDRGFVLVPLADVAPDWRHPVSGQTVRALLAALPAAEKADIHPL